MQKAQRSSVKITPTSKVKLTFKICKTKLNRNSYVHVDVWSTETIQQLKEEIARKVSIKSPIEDYSLLVYNEQKNKWENIQGLNSSLIAHEPKLTHGYFLTIEKSTEKASSSSSNSKQTAFSNGNRELSLKLCESTMDENTYNLITVDSSFTFGKLRRKAYEALNKTANNRSIFRKNNDSWMRFDADMDGKTLNDLGFEPNQLISIDDEDDEETNLALADRKDLLTFKICKTKRTLQNYEYLEMRSSDTLERLKMSVAQKLSIDLQLKDFYLEIFNKNNGKWEEIDESNACCTIKQLKLADDSLLIIGKRTDNVSKDNRSPKPTPRSNGTQKLALRLCKYPLDTADFILINIDSSSTLGKLRQEVYDRLNESRKDQGIYKGDKNSWSLLKSDKDKMTLLELGFVSNQYITLSNANENVQSAESSNKKSLKLKVCKTKQNSADCIYLDALSSDTVRTLKTKIAQCLRLGSAEADFSLEKFEKNARTWQIIDDSNPNTTLDQLGLLNDSLVSIRYKTKETQNGKSSESAFVSYKSSDLSLKLCQKPFNTSKCVSININSLSTLEELRKQAYTALNKTPSNLPIYKGNNGIWTSLKFDMDAKKLVDLAFKSGEFISLSNEIEDQRTTNSSHSNRLRLKICKNNRNQTNYGSVEAWSSDTIKVLKEKLASYLLADVPRDCILEIFDQDIKRWKIIDDSSPNATLEELGLQDGSVLNLQQNAKSVQNNESSTKTTQAAYEHYEIHLKLCVQPKDRTSSIELIMESTSTVGELRKEAYEKLHKLRKNLPIYRSDNDSWIPFGPDMDDRILCAVGFESNQFISLTNEKEYVQTTESFSKRLKLKICKGKRNQNDCGYIDACSSDTVRAFKQKLANYLPMDLEQEDFIVEIFNESTRKWTPIDDQNPLSTLGELGLKDQSFLNIERKTKPAQNNGSSSQTTSVSNKSHELNLKLCNQPMNRAVVTELRIDSLSTLGDLRKKAYEKFNKSSKNRPIYRWDKDSWMQFESDMDNRILQDLSFENYQIISTESDEQILDLKIPSGLCGLVNLGSTCFMNSVLQCLSNIPKFARRIMELDEKFDAPIISEYKKLVKEMWSGKNRVLRPSSLLNHIQDNLPRYVTYRQQDAQEFMNHFLDLIHTELSTRKTLITDIFYGRLQSTVKCLTCKETETKLEPFTFLPIPMKNSTERSVLYIKPDGEQRRVSIKIDSSVKTVGDLVDCFIHQTESKLDRKRIRVVKLLDNLARGIYEFGKSLQLIDDETFAFIECPEKGNGDIDIYCDFVDKSLEEAFRPPLVLVCPSVDCYYLHLSEQIDQIVGHLCSITNARMSDCHIFWMDRFRREYKLNIEGDRGKDLPNICYISIKMDTKWVKIYKDHYRTQQSNDNSILTNLLATFFRDDFLDGDYHCSKCSKMTLASHKSDLFQPLPYALIIQLKRFTYDISSKEKIDTFVSFPLYDLDLQQYVVKDMSNPAQSSSSTKYDLVAVSNHSGSLVSGHYVTYAKNMLDKNWYKFDDDYVRKLDSDQDVVTKNAYILVYVQKDDN